MHLKHVASTAANCLRVGLASLALFQFTIGASLANAAPNPPHQSEKESRDNETRTPIKHVIVIIGENRSYDHVFATYVPRHGQYTWNLLSQGIVNANGTPGPNFYKFQQKAALDQTPDAFLLDPPKQSFPNGTLPAPLVGGPKVSYIPTTDPITMAPLTPAQQLADAEASDAGLDPSYSALLLTGGTGQSSQTPDDRIADVNSLPPGPFQLTGSGFSYDDYAASPVHRFYQMWQQLDCSLSHASWEYPNGCDASLFSWVEVTEGAGQNGLPQPTDFGINYSPSGVTTGEGSTALGFYNVQKGDVPYFKSLADTYAMSDNFHQSVNGGTGANHIMLGHGDAIWFSDANGKPTQPPHLVPTGGTTSEKTPTVLDEVENPNPGKTITGNPANNWYTEDGYGGGSYGSPAYGGGSYSDCSDPSQPGVAPVLAYLKSVHVNPNCQPGHYYLLNNYNPGYFGQGENAFTDNSPLNTVFTVPPSSTPSIGDTMLKAGVSWKYYGDQWNDYAGNTQLGIPEDKYEVNYGAVGSLNELGTAEIKYPDEYCNICNPFQYDTSIMGNPAIRDAHIDDISGPDGLYSDITNGTLPAVSFVKPSGFTDGHPASSKLDLFEGFTQKIITAVQKSEYWQNTVIFITFDEGGGYYDSGYVQPLDFFGDGTRIPLIAVSPYTVGGRVTHNYADHVSILKFIERNWDLPTVSYRSRDNDPDPIALPINPYVPINGPAISDLFELFDFGQGGHGHGEGGGR
ncbi:MAG TPA: alkaline phosphatase family protein [Candidatus Baltobacteraceae bacterium]|nr:alkaline phosphatase family protein [Candidatus Baltobacteraceae bacterium]